MEVEETELQNDVEDLACATPGKKIRSKGKGRGQARGGGFGPIGIPIGAKK